MRRKRNRNGAARNNSHAIGLSGEFLVAAEMAKRGWEVVHTSHGHPGYDLLAHKDGRVVGIRVKAASDTTIKWTAKNDGLLAHYKPGNADDFTAMVLFDKGGVQGARIYVVPTDVVVQAVERDDEFYHRHPNKDGSKRAETPLRVMRFSGKDRPTNTAYGYEVKFAGYLDGWDLLDKLLP